MAKKKIGVLTGGGDAPGLNAVIYALTKTCILKYDYELIGYIFGYNGLYENQFTKLDLGTTRGILHRGGTIIHSSNKDNLFKHPHEVSGVTEYWDESAVAIKNLRDEGVDVLCVLGGDGTLTSARDFARRGVNVIGIPKTIDNDLACTDVTFGFDSAVNVVTENLGRLHTTAESHHRVMIAEVMGRSAGWIALQAGIAGSADVILIPEIPYDIGRVVDKINERDAKGSPFTIIIVGEGSKPKDGEAVVGKIVDDSPDPIRFGGIGQKLAHDLEPLIKNEVRSVAFGHIQRGGEPSPADRVLSVRYGVAAADLIAEGKYGNMVNIRDGKIGYVSLEDVIGANKLVEPDDELMHVARSLGICFGD